MNWASVKVSQADVFVQTSPKGPIPSPPPEECQILCSQIGEQIVFPKSTQTLKVIESVFVCSWSWLWIGLHHICDLYFDKDLPICEAL